MAKVTVEFGEVIVEAEAVETLWALRSQLEIPLAHIRGSAPAPVLARLGPRSPERGATDVPGEAWFVRHGGCVYWAVRDPAKALVIDLMDERCAGLVVEVDDPAGVAGRINRALAAWTRRHG